MEGTMLQAYEIKRQILEQSEKSPVKAKMDANPPGISTGEMIELGNELDRTTKTPGWAILEQYMLSRMNLVGLAVSDGSDLNRGVAKGFIEFMQWIDLVIKRRNKLLEEERSGHETKSVPENKVD
jgi:hypothetical protein